MSSFEKALETASPKLHSMRKTSMQRAPASHQLSGPSNTPIEPERWADSIFLFRCTALNLLSVHSSAQTLHPRRSQRRPACAAEESECVSPCHQIDMLPIWINMHPVSRRVIVHTVAAVAVVILVAAWIRSVGAHRSEQCSLNFIKPFRVACDLS